MHCRRYGGRHRPNPYPLQQRVSIVRRFLLSMRSSVVLDGSGVLVFTGKSFDHPALNRWLEARVCYETTTAQKCSYHVLPYESPPARIHSTHTSFLNTRMLTFHTRGVQRLSLATTFINKVLVHRMVVVQRLEDEVRVLAMLTFNGPSDVPLAFAAT